MVDDTHKRGLEIARRGAAKYRNALRALTGRPANLTLPFNAAACFATADDVRALLAVAADEGDDIDRQNAIAIAVEILRIHPDIRAGLEERELDLIARLSDDEASIEVARAAFAKYSSVFKALAKK